MRGSTRAQRRRSTMAKRRSGGRVVREERRVEAKEGRSEGRVASAGPEAVRVSMKDLMDCTDLSWAVGPSLARSLGRGGALMKRTGLVLGLEMVGRLRPWCGCGGKAIWESRVTLPLSLAGSAPI